MRSIHPKIERRFVEQNRRDFLTTTASGLGLAGLGSVLQDDGLLQTAGAAEQVQANPLAPRSPHFEPRAKACIFVFMAGAPSQLDLFDPKPKLNELHQQPLPESFTKNVRFAFIKKESATLMGSSRKFTRHGECGMEFSDLLPHMGTCADDLLMIGRFIRAIQSSSWTVDDAMRSRDVWMPTMGHG